MRVSLNWLADYVDLTGLSVDDVSRILTGVGLEVEAVESASPFPETVVVAHVIEAKPHPNADNLRVCRVDAGTGVEIPVVCGAPNCRTGLRVALAKSGTELPGGIKLKPTKIRGETSEGMMCSEKELGLSVDHGGIIELPESAPIGTPIVDLKKLRDTVLTLNVTPNRGDCLGMIGVAREVAAKTGRELRMPETRIVGGAGGKSQGVITIDSESAEGCPRFVGLYVKDIPQGESPEWMKRRLTAAGIRPTSATVDVTNYVMLEFGQPIHAYDEADVDGRKLVAREAHAGEIMTTLDGQQRTLVAGDLVIADNKRVVGIAGIMGGANSEIKTSTRNVIVEVAFFDPARVRQTAKRLALHTDASHRFERTVNIQATADVARRTGYLMDRVAAEMGLPRPAVADDVVDHYPRKHTPGMIALRMGRARKLLSMSVLKQSDVEGLLGRLGFRMVDHKDERVVFEVPAWRSDVMREADLIEEIARVTGFDKIPMTMPRMEIAPLHEDPFIVFLEHARVAAAQLGMVEVITFPFMSGGDLEKLRLAGEHPLTATRRLANPIDEKEPLMVTTLVPNMLKSALDNRRHGEFSARLFEVGRAFLDPAALTVDTARFPRLAGLFRRPRHITERASKDKRLVERYIMSGIIDQPLTQKTWNTTETPAGFHHGKELVAGWLRSFGLTRVDFKRCDATETPFLHPGQSAWMEVGGRYIGFVGELHPEVAVAYDLGADKAPIVLEIDLEAVLESSQKTGGMDTVSRRFPPATRDLAFVVDRGVSNEDFEGAIASFPKRQHLVRYSLFDVYSGKGLPEGKQSLAYAFRFQSADRTLTDKEVETEVTALISWIQDKLSATLRQ